MTYQPQFLRLPCLPYLMKVETPDSKKHLVSFREAHIEEEEKNDPVEMAVLKAVWDRRMAEHKDFLAEIKYRLAVMKAKRPGEVKKQRQNRTWGRAERLHALVVKDVEIRQQNWAGWQEKQKQEKREKKKERESRKLKLLG